MKFFLFSMCFLFSLCCYCQHQVIDSIVQIEIVDSVRRSSISRSHLPDVLRQISTLHLRSRGANSSISASILGGGSSHMDFYWNGIPLSNPMIGQVDLSLIPHVFLDELDVSSTSNDQFILQNLSGAISAKTKPVNRSGFTGNIHGSIGSYNFYQSSIQLNYKKGHFQVSFRGHYESAKNNYPYTTPANNQERRLAHGESKNGAGLWNVMYQNGKHQIKLHYWKQRYERNLPPTTVQNLSKESQTDGINRGGIQYKYTSTPVTIKLNHSLSNENIFYKDSLNQDYSYSQFSKIFTSLNTTIPLQNHTLNSTIEVQNNIGTIRYYEGNRKEQHQLIWQLQDKFIYHKTTLSGGISKIFSSSSKNPFNGFITINQALQPTLNITFNTNVRHRIPSLNELYWRPGGNINLLPEKSFNNQLTVLKIFKYWSLKSQLFYRYTYDWILWYRPLNETFFFPSNVEEVKSFGINANLQSKLLSLNNHILLLNGGYNLSHSKIQIDLDNPSLSAGDQLWYIPVHKLTSQLSYQGWKTWATKIFYTYQSQTQGPIGKLDSYKLFDINVSKTIKYNTTFARILLEVNNLFNEQYQLIERRPMIGRHYKFRIELNF